MLTLDDNGHVVEVEDEKLSKAEKEEKLYTVNTSIPLVPDRGSYANGAKVNINFPYATMNTPINVEIVYIRGYIISDIKVYVDDGPDGRYMNDDEFSVQDNGVRTKLVSFIMPMANVDINIELKKEEINK